MDFVTTEYYLYFLPAAFILSIWLCFGVRKYQISILLLMSYLFLVRIWVASNSTTNFHLCRLDCGNKIATCDDRSVRIKWLRASLVTNLTLLGVFKYLDFIIESFNWFSLKIPGSREIETLGLMLPVEFRSTHFKQCHIQSIYIKTRTRSSILFLTSHVMLHSFRNLSQGQSYVPIIPSK